ncbi:protein nutcracker isoform X1 [Drosophila montana]|uniref:protein nutcracker isoform X1 n=1 Tax=Drosophila montana TaxID=40370 RepID=UPI00313A8D5F
MHVVSNLVTHDTHTRTADSQNPPHSSTNNIHTTPMQEQPQQQQQLQHAHGVLIAKPCLITAASESKIQAEKEKEKEPLCLENATPDAVPLHLREMLSQFSQRKLSAAELLMLLIYLVALESGFVENQSYLEKRALLKPVSAVGSFHLYNVRLLSHLPTHYTREFEDTAFRMLLRTLLDSKSSEEPSMITALQSSLIAIVLGDLMVVTLSPVAPSKERGFSTCLSIGRFVLNVQLEPIYQRFCKLDELSLQLRQNLFQPMRAQQLLALDLHPHPSLLGLPSVVYDEIFKHLNKNQLNILANVNWKLCNYKKQFKDRRRK